MRTGFRPADRHCKRWLAGAMLASAALLLPAGRVPAQVQPVKGDIGVHDPVMIKAGDTYYIFHTGRGISIKTSKDRVNWRNAGRVFADGKFPGWHQDLVPGHDGNIWAPDIHYRNGLYHLYYSVSLWMNFNSAVGYATNTTLDPADPDYQWVDRGPAVSYRTTDNTGVNVIDPNAFVDTDGKVWLLYGSYRSGLRMLEVNPATGLAFNATPAITTLTTSLGEGVFLIKLNGWYYILASRGRCCAGMESTYHVVMGRSRNVKGPYLNKAGASWVNNNYTVLMPADDEHPGQGHNGIFVERDTVFMVYHAYTRSANGASLLNIRPLFVDKDGWLTLDPRQAVSLPTALGRTPARSGTRPSPAKVIAGLPGWISPFPEGRLADLHGLDGRRLPAPDGQRERTLPAGIYLAKPLRPSP